MKNEEHTIILITCGTLELTDLKGTIRFQSGDLCFCSGKSLSNSEATQIPQANTRKSPLNYRKPYLKLSHMNTTIRNSNRTRNVRF